MLWRTPSARFWRNLPAGFIQPCQPTLVANPPAGPGWLHEVKHDGFRILARKQGEDVAVWSRRGALFNDSDRFLESRKRWAPCPSTML